MRNFVRKAIHTNSPPLVWPSNFHKIGLFAKKHKTSSKHRIWINFCVKFTPRRRCLGRPTWSLVGPIGRDTRLRFTDQFGKTSLKWWWQTHCRWRWIKLKLA